MGQVAGPPKRAADAQLKVGDRLATFARQVTTDKMIEFEKVVWDRGRNAHSDPAAAQSDGLTQPLASGQNQLAFLHEMLERNFGDAWVYGGKVSVRFIHPVYALDQITPHGIVTDVTEAAGRQRVALSIWCENQGGQKTAAGTASAWQPSPSRSWIDRQREQVS